MAEAAFRLTERPKARLRPGHCVTVLKDGADWGKLATNPEFMIVKRPGVPVAEMKKYLQPKTEIVEVVEEPMIRFEAEVVGPRRYRLRVEALDGQLRQVVESRKVEVGRDCSWEDLRPFMRNEETGRDEVERQLNGNPSR